MGTLALLSKKRLRLGVFDSTDVPGTAVAASDAMSEEVAETDGDDDGDGDGDGDGEDGGTRRATSWVTTRTSGGDNIARATRRPTC